jgi:hypothetical protein
MFTLTWLLAIVVCKEKMAIATKCTSIADHFNDHVDAPVQCGAPCLMMHIHDFTQCH